MIDEFPRGNLESVREMLGESFDAEGLGRIVAAVDQVNAQLFSGGVGPMLALPRDEGIDALSRGGETTRRQLHPLQGRDAGPWWVHPGRDGTSAPTACVIRFMSSNAGHLDLKLQPERDPFPGQKRFPPPPSSRPGQAARCCRGPGVRRAGCGRYRPPDHDSRAVFQLLIRGSLNRLRAGPEHPVVHQQQIGSGLHRFLPPREDERRPPRQSW